MRRSAAFLTRPADGGHAVRPAAGAAGRRRAAAGGRAERPRGRRRDHAADGQRRAAARLGAARALPRRRTAPCPSRPPASPGWCSWATRSPTPGRSRASAISSPSNKSYVGRGISGQTTPQMLIRFRPDVIDLQSEGGGHPRRHQRHRRQHRADDQRGHPEQPDVDGGARQGQQDQGGPVQHPADQQLPRRRRTACRRRRPGRWSAFARSTTG